MILLFSQVEGENSMLDSIKMVKLDCLTVKGYTKQILLSYLMLTIVISTTLPYMLNVVYFVCGSSFLIYPFMVAEQNGMDKFYTTVSTTKQGMIGSKYLESILYLMITIVVLIPINILIYTMSGETLSLYLLIGTLLIGMMFYCIVTSIQIPCCFKWGYAKSKVINMILPIAIGIGIPSLFYILTKFITKEELWKLMNEIGYFVASNTTEIFIGSFLLGGLSLLISYKISFEICR